MMSGKTGSRPAESEQAAGRAALAEHRQYERERPPEMPPPHIATTAFERWVVTQLRTLRGENQAILTLLQQLETTMDYNTRALISAVTAAETKLDGYVQIINAGSAAITTAVSQLADLQKRLAGADLPGADEIKNTIDGLNQHLSGVDDAVQHLSDASKPPAPPATDPQPIPNPTGVDTTTTQPATA